MGTVPVKSDTGASNGVMSPRERLLPQHLEDLKRSGLNEDTIRRCGFQSITRPESIAKWLKWKTYNGRLGPCLGIPFFDLNGKRNGYVRLKPDNPRTGKNGKPNKYESPVGTGNRAYFPPDTVEAIRSPLQPLIITEGEKKAAKATQEGFPCIGLVGVYGWIKTRPRDKAGKPIGKRELTDCLRALAWEGRTVYLCFDSDVMDNRNVQWAERHLAKVLTGHGAIVKIVRLLANDTGANKVSAKVGLDDFLMAHGADAFRHLLESADKSTNPHTTLRLEFCNFEAVETGVDDKGKPTKAVKGLSIETLRQRLFAATEDWPKRVGSLLFGRDNDKPVFLEKPPDLFAFIGGRLCNSKGHVQWLNPVKWMYGPDMVTQPQFFAYLQQTSENFAAVESFPHYPPLKDHFYIYPEIPKSNRKALTLLLQKFQPASVLDSHLLHAFFLSLFCGVPAGQRPAWLITSHADDESAGRGVGKTSLVKIASRLVGGLVAFSSQDDMSDLIKRLLSPDARGKRIVLMDNIKSLRFSHAELEGMITCDVISGRQLYVGEGRRPNTLTWCLTINGASLSKDLSQRCVPIELARPKYGADWEQETVDFIETNKWEIIGDILADLRAHAPKLARHSRWGAWEDVVLARLPDPAAVQSLIEDRQAAIDDDQSEAELVRDAFEEELHSRGQYPDLAVVRMPSRFVAMIVNKALNEQKPVNKVSSHLKMLAIAELRKSDRKDFRGWVWYGRNADPNVIPITIHE